MGMAQLSRTLSIPVIWVTASARWNLRAPLWDKFMLPLPFSRVVVWFSPPILPADYAHLTLEEYHDAIDQKGRDYLESLDTEAGVLLGEDRALLAKLRS
jgi:lysophospholipid acyltransferase (LPLAT)-like uncharacterized protein